MSRRVMLKLSGEALAGPEKTGFHEDSVQSVVRQIVRAQKEGCEIAVVIGGGNFWRGRSGGSMDRVKADQIGMLATVMNCLYVAEAVTRAGAETEVYCAFPVEGMAKAFSVDDARRDMREGKIVFFAGGTGHPYFSTDTGVVLRAVEMGVEEILLAKAVDGVYDSDPAKNPQAVKFDTISIEEVVERKLGVIDLTASILAMEHRIPLAVFGLAEEDGIYHAIQGKITGTRITV